MCAELGVDHADCWRELRLRVEAVCVKLGDHLTRTEAAQAAAILSRAARAELGRDRQRRSGRL